jgi:hypothetical protein
MRVTLSCYVQIVLSLLQNLLLLLIALLLIICFETVCWISCLHGSIKLVSVLKLFLVLFLLFIRPTKWHVHFFKRYLFAIMSIISPHNIIAHIANILINCIHRLLIIMMPILCLLMHKKIRY